MFFHLDAPLGIIVQARDIATFRGWALDTNNSDAAELRLFAGARQVRVDRYQRSDAIAAFEGKVSKNAKAAFEAKVPLDGWTWIRIEVAVAPDEWLVVHRALMPFFKPALKLRPDRTYEPVEWLNVEQGHLRAQADEMRAHINAMVLRPAFFVVLDARKSGRNLDAILASLRPKLQRCPGGGSRVRSARQRQSGAQTGRDHPTRRSSGSTSSTYVARHSGIWIISCLSRLATGSRIDACHLRVRDQPLAVERVIYADELFRTWLSHCHSASGLEPIIRIIRL